MKTVMQFIRDEDGLTTVEYAVAGALIAATVAVAFRNLGVAVETKIGILGTIVAIPG